MIFLNSNMGSQKGMVKLIIIIVIALLILSYFGYNIRSIANSPNTQDNFSYVGGVVVDIWNNYLKTPVVFVWNIFIDFVWNPAMHSLQNSSNGEPTNIQQAQTIKPVPGH